MSHLTFGRFLVASNTNVICQDSSLAIQLCVTLSGDCDYPIHASATDLVIGDSVLIKIFGEVFAIKEKPRVSKQSAAAVFLYVLICQTLHPHEPIYFFWCGHASSGVFTAGGSQW